MHIDLRDLPRRLTLAAGDQVTLTLPSFLGSGNAWSAHCESGADVALVSIAMEPPSPSSVTTGMLGPPEPSIATELAIVRAVAPGTARWWLHLARSFAPPTHGCPRVANRRDGRYAHLRPSPDSRA